MKKKLLMSFKLLLIMIGIFNPFTVNAQSELNVGDYIELVPDSSSYTISKDVSGYSSNQTINPKELTLWRIIKINDDGTYDAVSEYLTSSTVRVYYRTGYANYIQIFNNIATAYKNNDFTVRTRIMGYDGQSPSILDVSPIESQTAPQLWSTPSPTTGDGEEYSGGLYGDTLYLKDYLLVSDVYKNESDIYGENGLIAYKVGESTPSNYILLSRIYVGSSSHNYYFGYRKIGTSGQLTWNSFGTLSGYEPRTGNYRWISDYTNYPFRPIITLSTNFKINNGSGEKTEPYTLRKPRKSNIIIDNDNIKGNINTNSINNINEDSTVSFSLESNEGYILTDLNIVDSNNNTIEYTKNGNTYSFIMPSTNVTITSIYEKTISSISVELVDETEELNIEINDITRVEYGEEVNFSVTPIKGFEVKNLKIVDTNNNEINYSTIDNENYKFIMPATDIRIIPSYERVKNSVNVLENENTKEFIIEVNDAKAIVYESNVVFTLEPADGYEVESIEIIDENGNRIEYKVLDNNKYEFIMPDNNVKIKPAYRKIKVIDSNTSSDNLKNPKTGNKILTIIFIVIMSLGIGKYFYRKNLNPTRNS